MSASETKPQLPRRYVRTGQSVARAYDQSARDHRLGTSLSRNWIVESEIADRLGSAAPPRKRAAIAFSRATSSRFTVGRAVASSSRRSRRTTRASSFTFRGSWKTRGRSAAELPSEKRGAVVKRLRALNRDLAQAARESRPDPLRIFDLDTAFHRTYVESGAGPRLLALHDATKPQAERYIRLYISSLVDEITTSVEEHDVIIRHIADGDPVAARQAVDTNWSNAALRLSKVIGALGERGSW